MERRTRCSYFFNRIDYYDEERVGHSEQHPDVNHLNVACAWQIPRDPDVAENKISESSKDIYLSILTK